MNKSRNTAKTLLIKYSQVCYTEDIKEVIGFIKYWSSFDEEIMNEYPLFCANGLEFFNFQSTDGAALVFTVYNCKSSEYSFNFNTLLKEGFVEYLRLKNFEEDDIFQDVAEVGILYNETVVDEYIKYYESNFR